MTTTNNLGDDLDARFVANATKRYEDKLASLAEALRRLAADIERDGIPGRGDYFYAAQNVIHTLHWGIANLNADQLLGAAADAHNAVRGQVK